MDAGISVTVRYEQFAGIRVDSDVGRTVEIPAALPLTRLALNADGHLLDTFLVELPHVVTVIIDDENVVVAVDLDAVRTRHGTVEHCSDQIAFRAEHTDRVSAPIEDVNVVLGVDGYRGCVAVERGPHGKIGPPGDRLPLQSIGVAD